MQQQAASFSDKFLRLEQVKSLSGFSRSSIYGRIRAGNFPPPIKIGRSSRWRESLVVQWMDAQAAPTAVKVGGEVQR